MYSFRSRVRYSETEEGGRLSITGIMNYFQDCSTFQSESLGLGLEHLKSVHRAWFLSSWQIVIDRYPVLGEEITIATWPYDFNGIYGSRNFAILDVEGNYLVRANSLWFFVDTQTGRPVKPQESDISGYEEEPKLEMDYAPRKIKIPVELQKKGSVVAAKHHIDSNHHVNNAQYVDMAREVLPENAVIQEVRVEYKKAAVIGDEIGLYAGKAEEGYFVSLCDGEQKPYAVVQLKMK